MFRPEEKRNFNFYDRINSEEASKEFAKNYLQGGKAQLNYGSNANSLKGLDLGEYSRSIHKESSLPSFQVNDLLQHKLPNLELLQEVASLSVPEIPSFENQCDISDYLDTKSEIIFKDFALRTLDVQTTQFALHAMEEEITRSKVLIDIEKSLDAPNSLFGSNKLAFKAIKKPLANLTEWMNYVDLELRNLYNQATSIGKATLPSQLMLDLHHKKVLDLIEQGEYLKAKHLLIKEIIDKNFLNGKFLDKLKRTGIGLGIVSAATVAYNVGTSEDKLEQVEKEVITFTGGFAAGLKAGELALPYCSKLPHPIAKTVCQIGATAIGSIVGAEVVNDLYNKAIEQKNTEASDKILSNASKSTFFKPEPKPEPPTFSLDRDRMPTFEEFFNPLPDPDIKLPTLNGNEIEM